MLSVWIVIVIVHLQILMLFTAFQEYFQYYPAEKINM